MLEWRKTYLSDYLDDNMPKAGNNGYAFFVQTCQEEYKRRFPDELVVREEFQKKCADRWKTMSERERRRFCEKAEEAGNGRGE